MSRRALMVTAAVAALGLWAWRAELFTVSRPGDRPRALVLVPERSPVGFDVVLPAVPVGMRRLRDGEGVLLVHYWAAWERHAREQIVSLDSLRRLPELERLQVVVVCFDPFPSVTRYVARQRLRLSVLLDGDHRLRAALPCPSVPYTYVIDHARRIAVAQPGEVDWWASATRTALLGLLDERDTSRAVPLPI
ncbi:MAG TPA: redoxin domain-containing protein [Candidatus Limnocylindria bacterium]|nr:redoxin domain-containing protein [Candidatus Limnocylindria bacterium]